MPYRGYFALNGNEITNSSRVIAHVGGGVPTTDYGFWGTPPDDEDCAPTQVTGYLLYPSDDLSPGDALFPDAGTGPRLLYEVPSSSVPIAPGRLLYTPPNGSRKFSAGLVSFEECWGLAASCASCKTHVGYDDSWPGLQAFLDDYDYRPELSPWYTTEIPESGEFGGVWVMGVSGLDVTPVERGITQTIGHGAIAGPYRDAGREGVRFEALILACTNAGAEFGVQWLNCLLRSTNDDVDTTLRYLKASPHGSGVDPETLVREAHGVVLTKPVEILDRVVTTSGSHQHANLYRIAWEMAALSPYAYMPAVPVAVTWDQITRQPINWIHSPDCEKPETCIDMPVMFSATCVPEDIERVVVPPPVCGGCLPVGAIDKYSFRVPTTDWPYRCRETAVSMIIKNTGEDPLTLQAFWRICGADTRCEDNLFPLQIAGLPADAELHLSGVTGRFQAWYDERWRRVVGVVGTPNGAPWRPPIIDRRVCWDFIVQTASTSEFEVSMTLIDREA
jgi:hypothetical protein